MNRSTPHFLCLCQGVAKPGDIGGHYLFARTERQGGGAVHDDIDFVVMNEPVHGVGITNIDLDQK